MSHLHVHGPGEHHQHGHSHHGHSPGRVADASREADHIAPMRRLRGALAVTAIFLVVEVIGGWLANSLALLADAGHMLTDVAALALSLFVAWFSRQPASPQRTYGYLRWEVLAAFLNGATLLLISAWIVWEAVLRLRAPEPIQGGLMLGVAVAGLIVNVIAARMLHASGESSLNMRAAYLHVLSDLLGSVGTVAAAVIVKWTGWVAADPVALWSWPLLSSAARGGSCESRSMYCSSRLIAHLARLCTHSARGYSGYRVRARPACVDRHIRTRRHERTCDRSRVRAPPARAGARSRCDAAVRHRSCDRAARAQRDVRTRATPPQLTQAAGSSSVTLPVRGVTP